MFRRVPGLLTGFLQALKRGNSLQVGLRAPVPGCWSRCARHATAPQWVTRCGGSKCSRARNLAGRESCFAEKAYAFLWYRAELRVQACQWKLHLRFEATIDAVSKSFSPDGRWTAVSTPCHMFAGNCPSPEDAGGCGK